MVLFIFAAIIIGVMMPLQAGINSRLTQFLFHPSQSALISFFIGTIALIALTIILSPQYPNLRQLAAIPPHLYIGGILGAIFVGSSIFLLPQIGATAMITAFITGQLLGSLVIDHYGFFGVPLHPMSIGRFFAVILMAISLVLFRKF